MTDGSILVARFDPTSALDGALMAFNGPMPGFRENSLVPGHRFGLTIPETSHFDAIERTQNLPAALLPRTRVNIPRPPGNNTGHTPY